MCQIIINKPFGEKCVSNGVGAPVWVVAVALLDAEGRVLMQRRPEGRQHGLLWEFPGGKIERGESGEAAAVREIAEELGLVLDAPALVPVGFASNGGEGRGEGAGRAVTLLLYAARAWRGAARALDGQTLDWFAPADVPGLAMPPLDYPLARALIGFVESGLVPPRIDKK